MDTTHDNGIQQVGNLVGSNDGALQSQLRHMHSELRIYGFSRALKKSSSSIIWVKILAICAVIYLLVMIFFLFIVIPLIKIKIVGYSYDYPTMTNIVRSCKAAVILASVTTVVIWFGRVRSVDR